jgi:hypothetical protein
LPGRGPAARKRWTQPYTIEMSFRSLYAAAAAGLLLLLAVAVAADPDAAEGSKGSKSAAKGASQSTSSIIPTAGEAKLTNGIGDVLPGGGSALDRPAQPCHGRWQQPERRVTFPIASQDPASPTPRRSARGRPPARGGWRRASRSGSPRSARATSRAAPCQTRAPSTSPSSRSTAATTSTRTCLWVRQRRGGAAMPDSALRSLLRRGAVPLPPPKPPAHAMLEPMRHAWWQQGQRQLCEERRHRGPTATGLPAPSLRQRARARTTPPKSAAVRTTRRTQAAWWRA